MGGLRSFYCSTLVLSFFFGFKFWIWTKLNNKKICAAGVDVWLDWSLDLVVILVGGGKGRGGLVIPSTYSSLAKIRLHTENWLYTLPGTALKFPWGCGGF